MEGIEATKPSVMITYPETIHFSTTCMIKDTDLTSWDEIWYVISKIDRLVCYKLDAFCNIKGDFSVTNSEKLKKFIFTYGIGEVLIEQGSNNLIIPGVYYAPEVTLNILSLELLEKQGFSVGYDGNRCNLFPMFKDRKIHHFDEDKMKKMHNQYLQDYFESIASKEGMEQEIVRIKGNLYSTKVQTFNDFVTFLNLIKHDEIVSQEWDYFRNRSAVPNGKEVIDHFGVQLEDTTNYTTEPTQGHYMESQQKFYTLPSSTKIKEEHASSTSSDDFEVIT
nr:ARID DNA-binding domain-containing protein [Tanacetum cinerariifolium]